MNVVIQLFLYDWSKCSNPYEKMRKEFRIQEFATVLRLNLSNPHIKSIHILCETQDASDFYESVANEFIHESITAYENLINKVFTFFTF